VIGVCKRRIRSEEPATKRRSRSVILLAGFTKSKRARMGARFRRRFDTELSNGSGKMCRAGGGLFQSLGLSCQPPFGWPASATRISRRGAARSRKRHPPKEPQEGAGARAGVDAARRGWRNPYLGRGTGTKQEGVGRERGREYGLGQPSESCPALAARSRTQGVPQATAHPSPRARPSLFPLTPTASSPSPVPPPGGESGPEGCFLPRTWWPTTLTLVGYVVLVLVVPVTWP
jgi:hypothetical protein